MEKFERVKSLHDDKVYQVTAVGSGMFVLRSIKDGELILEDLGNSDFYKKIDRYGNGK